MPNLNNKLISVARAGLFGATMGAAEFFKDIEKGDIFSAPTRSAIAACIYFTIALKYDNKPLPLAGAVFLLNLISFNNVNRSIAHGVIAGGVSALSNSYVPHDEPKPARPKQ